MALTSGQVTVNNTAVQVDGASVNPIHLHIHNPDNTKDIYLGDETVTALTGMVLPKLDSIEITIYPGNRLFAIAPAGGVLHYLKQDL